MASLMAELAKFAPGGTKAGQDGSIWMTGPLFGRFGIDYWSSNGTNRLRIYGNYNGSSVVNYNVGGGNGLDRNTAVIRTDGTRGVEIYNLDLDGRATLGNSTSGAQSGMIVGAHWSGDNNRADVFDLRVQGVRLRDVRQSGMKIDGDNGTDGVTVYGCTVQRTGRGHSPGSSASGYGEGIYCGDGNSGRSYSNVTVERCEVMDVLQGEGLEGKRNGQNVLFKDNYVHDVVIHSGAGVKFEDNVPAQNYQMIGNVVHDVTVNGDSAANTGAGFMLTGGGTIKNCLAYECDRPVEFALAKTSGVVGTLEQNTWVVPTGGDAAYRFGGSFGDGARTIQWDINARDNIVVGNHHSGGQWSSASFTNEHGGSFVGPTSGSSDAGDGPGTGYVLSGGSGRNAVSNVLIDDDLRGWARTNPSDAGALDADSVPPSTGGGLSNPTPFEIVSPAEGSADITSPVTITGTGAPGIYEVEVYNMTTSTDISAFGAAAVTHDAALDTWVSEPIPVPEDGSTVRFDARKF